MKIPWKNIKETFYVEHKAESDDIINNHCINVYNIYKDTSIRGTNSTQSTAYVRYNEHHINQEMNSDNRHC